MPAWIGCMYVPAHVTSDGGRTTPRRRDCVMPGAAGHALQRGHTQGRLYQVEVRMRT